MNLSVHNRAVATMDALIDDLIQRLADMENAEKITKMHQLENDSLALQRELHIASKRLSATTDLLKETTKLLQITFATAQAHKKKKIKVESGWRTYWGIAQRCEKAVFEMECIDQSVR